MAGSMLGNAMSGGGGMFGGGTASEASPAQAAAAPTQPMPAAQSPCVFENRQFLECMSNTGDNLEQCQGFFEAYSQCNRTASMQMQ
jgi:hypothetical protein